MAKDLIGATFTFEDLSVGYDSAGGELIASGAAYVTKDGDSTWTDPDTVKFTRLESFYAEQRETVSIDISSIPEDELKELYLSTAINLDAKGLASWLSEQLYD